MAKRLIVNPDGTQEFEEYTPDPVPSDPIPDSVTARQFKMQLVIAGLKDSVDSWVASQPEIVQVAYEYSGNFVRSEPMMQAGFSALGFSEDQQAAFWVEAAKL